MFAVVEIGGRQYKIGVNDKIEVEKLDKKEGENIQFDKVLLLSDEKDTKIGKPYLKGAVIEAKVLENFKGEKILVHKFIAKKRHSKTQGHRQNYTRLEILNIKA